MIASIAIFWVIFAAVSLIYTLITHFEHVDAPPEPVTYAVPDPHTHKAILARCEQQHELLMQGDDRGIYGRYPPADLS